MVLPLCFLLEGGGQVDSLWEANLDVCSACPPYYVRMEAIQPHYRMDGMAISSLLSIVVIVCSVSYIATENMSVISAAA